jgi:hypothetical protein
VRRASGLHFDDDRPSLITKRTATSSWPSTRAGRDLYRRAGLKGRTRLNRMIFGKLQVDWLASPTSRATS